MVIKAATAWQIWRSALTVEGLVLAVLGGAGLLLASRSPGPPLARDPHVLVFQLNPVHSGFLLGVGIIAMVAAQWPRSFLWWSALQLVGFLLLFLWGTAQSTWQETSTPFSLDASENFLHGALAALGFVFLVAGANMLGRIGKRYPEGLSS